MTPLSPIIAAIVLIGAHSLATTAGVTISAGDKMSTSFNEVGIVAGTDVRFTGTGRKPS